jgi:hypothetical protein
METIDRAVPATPALSELRPLRELQRELAHVFPSRGSLDWEVRAHRHEYVAAGAIFEVAGRLMAHPPTFARVALEIGARKVARVPPTS